MILPKLLRCATLGALLWGALGSGCATSVSPPASPTMTIAVSTPDAPPSNQQLAMIHQLLQPQIANRGFTVAMNPVSADYVMRVRFTPDASNPPGGHLTFVGIERNERRTSRGPENAAAEASASTLADLRRAISETDWINGPTK